ncbi:MAG: DUF2752 domain-containing protein [Leptolyngbyaceae bacterium]|nr:DUF2752 domain-containing protein [Leptolyngbyaceae bacterium]
MYHPSLWVERTPLSLQRKQKNRRRLAIAAIPLVGAVALNHGVHIPFLDCPLLRYIGIPCPAWGMTRSFMAIARGDLSTALHYNVLGPLVFAVFLIAVIHISLELVLNSQIRTFYSSMIQRSSFYIFSLFVLWGYQATRIYALWQSGELSTMIHHSLWGSLIFM